MHSHDDWRKHTLRATLQPDGFMWFIQGLECDYASAGETKTDAVDRFIVGLLATAKAQRKAFGRLRGLCRPAPYKAFEEASGLSVFSERNLPDCGLPFTRVTVLCA